MDTQLYSPRLTLQEQILDRLGLDICNGRYETGQVLPSEPYLGETFGVSRIVIREVIKSLAAKGMLEVRRKIGTTVLEQEHWNLFDPSIIAWRAQSTSLNRMLSRDLMELRRIVEPAAARLAAERASEAERQALRAAYIEMERAVSGQGDYVKADLAFHAVLLATCGNQFVRQMRQAFSAILRTSFEIVSHKPGGPAFSLPMHDDLCRAVESGDPVAAERAALALIEQADNDLAVRLSLIGEVK